MLEKMKKVILLEFVDEAKEILRRYGREFLLSEEALVICLHPNVRAFLKGAGIDSRDTLRYLDNDSQHRIMLETERLKDIMMQKVSLSDNLGIRKGYEETCAHNLRMYLNHFLWIIEIINAIVRKHQVSDIYCCLYGYEDPIYMQKAAIQDQERFLGFLARDISRANGIKFHACRLKAKRPGIINLICTAAAHKAGELLTFIEYRLLCARAAGKKTVIVPAFSYNMSVLLREIKSRRHNVNYVMLWENEFTLRKKLSSIYLLLMNNLKKIKRNNECDAIISLDLIKWHFKNDPAQQEKMRLEFDRLKAAINTGLKDLFFYGGVDFHSYLREKIDRGLKQDMLSLQRLTTALYCILKRLQPKLLMSMYSRGIYYMMGELSIILDFPSLNISHGTHVPPNNIFEEIENYNLGTSVILNTYKHVAVQTPWTDKFLNYFQDKRPRILSGPLLYSRKNTLLRDEKRKEITGSSDTSRIVIHATTQKIRTGMRFHITETLDEYILSLSDIVNAVNKLEDVYLVIRPHPICELTCDDFYRLLPAGSRVRIMEKGSFADSLSIADLLVSYSSTCIEEALQNRIPVVLFDKWKRYNHFNIKETKDTEGLARNPVFYFTEPGVLGEGIRRIMEEFQKQPLADADLVDYRYPETFRDNFSSFVDVSLKEGANN